MGSFESQSIWLSELGAVVVALVACALVVWASHGLSVPSIRPVLRARGRSAWTVAAAARLIAAASSRARAARPATTPTREVLGTARARRLRARVAPTAGL